MQQTKTYRNKDRHNELAEERHNERTTSTHHERTTEITTYRQEERPKSLNT